MSETENDLYGVCAQSADTVWAVGSANSLLHRTTTGWHKVVIDVFATFRAVTFVDNVHGWIVGSDGVTLRTVDGGETWTLYGVGVANLVTVTASDPAHVWTAGFNGVLRVSADSGRTWSIENAGTLNDVYALTLSGAERDTLWQAGRQRIALSTDGGAVWIDRSNSFQGPWKNIIARRAGAWPGRGIVLIGGHLDSHSETPWTVAPGADDNATGSAIVLEMARVLAPVAIRRDLWLVWFGGEEDGLLGSTALAAVQRAAGDSISLFFDVDEVGRGDSVAVYADARSSAAAESIASIGMHTVPDLPLAVRLTDTFRGSDHAPYWDNGYTALSFVEAAWQVNTDIESTADSLALVDTSLVARVARLISAASCTYLLPDTTSGVGNTQGDSDTGTSATLLIRFGQLSPSPLRSEFVQLHVTCSEPVCLDLTFVSVDGRQQVRMPSRTLAVGEVIERFNLAPVVRTNELGSGHNRSALLQRLRAGVYLWRATATTLDGRIGGERHGRLVILP
jgi:hypothetical protein